MISHNFLSRIAARSQDESRGDRLISAAISEGRGRAVRVHCVPSVWSAADGPLRVECHVAARLQRARVSSRLLPLGAPPRRLRWSVLLSGARLLGDRCWWQCADDGDRGVDCALCPVFGRTRALRAGALRHQRDAEGRQRGARAVEQQPETSCRHYRHGDVRRPWPQVSDLGAWPFPARARGGHPRGARAQGRAWLLGGGAQRARSTGIMAGGDGFTAVAGGSALHIPVLGRAAIDFLNVRDGGVYIDATFGGGGFSRALLAVGGARVIAIDR